MVPGTNECFSSAVVAIVPIFLMHHWNESSAKMQAPRWLVKCMTMHRNVYEPREEAEPRDISARETPRVDREARETHEAQQGNTRQHKGP